MKNHSTFIDLNNMLNEDSVGMDPVDFMDLCAEIQSLVAKKKEEAQDKIIDNLDSLIDSFGGKNCTMRDLKGDL